MGRSRRLQYENAWYHVMNRAAGKKPVFLDENSKYIFFEFLAEIYKKHDVQIHAFCLMDNHYHLLVNTPRANLAEAMHYLQFRFSTTYNKIILSDGPVFRSRYKSILIKNDIYLAQVCRYIHLNPVEAKFASGIDYCWSSYRHYLNKHAKPYWLTTDTLMEIITNNHNKSSFVDFHKENNSETLKKFYNNHERSKICDLELDLEDCIINLNSLDLLIKNILGNKRLNKFIFCFLARMIYRQEIIDVSNFLVCKNRSNVASLLSKNKSKIDSSLVLELDKLKDRPDVLIKLLYQHLK